MILHAPHSILKTSNTHVPICGPKPDITDLQTDKNKGNKARDIR